VKAPARKQLRDVILGDKSEAASSKNQNLREITKASEGAATGQGVSKPDTEKLSKIRTQNMFKDINSVLSGVAPAKVRTQPGEKGGANQGHGSPSLRSNRSHASEHSEK